MYCGAFRVLSKLRGDVREVISEGGREGGRERDPTHRLVYGSCRYAQRPDKNPSRRTVTNTIRTQGGSLNAEQPLRPDQPTAALAAVASHGVRPVPASPAKAKVPAPETLEELMARQKEVCVCVCVCVSCSRRCV